MTSNPGKGPLISAEPTRRHIRNLMAAGVSIKRIAETAGIGHAVVSGPLYNCGTRLRGERIRQQNADAILAIRAQDVVTSRTDATGTRRRLQALMAIGWPLLRLGPRIGRHPYYVTELLRAPSVNASTAHAVAVAYDRLWDQNPVHHGIPTGSATRARNYAKANGWAPPLAWDDDTIEDPNASPHLAPEPELGLRELAALRREEVEHLAGYGVPEADIVRRVGLAPSTVRQLVQEWRTDTRRDRKKVPA